jgi:serine/threonine-protein kinase
MQTVGGRYALDGHLGEGGMGQVYKARHLQLGKPFALKIIAPAFADDGAARARFNEEARLASEISHPNIVSVVDFG